MRAVKIGSLVFVLLSGVCFASLDGSGDLPDSVSTFDVSTFVTKTVEPTHKTKPSLFPAGPPPQIPREGPIRTKSGKKPLHLKMCNNDNFDGKIGYKVKQTGCFKTKAIEGECTKYLWHSPVTAISMPSEWKCVLYSRENCSTRDGRMTLIEEATRNIGPHMNDRMQSFRCLQQYDEQTAERAAVWACRFHHWQGPCQMQRPEIGRCVNLPGNLKDKIQSFTPYQGYVCTVYEHPRCNVEKKGYSVLMETPGSSMLGKLRSKISSIRCNHQNETAGVPLRESGSSREYEYGAEEFELMIGDRRYGNDGKKPKVMTPENWDLDFEFDSELSRSS
ncbi:hypothetical protein HDK77DRAFT_81989 [Phyllosticta capitalensis]